MCGIPLKIDYNRLYKEMLVVLKDKMLSPNDALLEINAGIKKDCFYAHISEQQKLIIQGLVEQNSRIKRKTNNTYLGRLCKNGHEYFNTGKTLRYKSNSMCVCCHNQKEGSQKQIQNDFIPIEMVLNKYPIKNNKHQLGRLCRKAHKYKNQNYSLRYISNGTCVICQENHVKEKAEHYKQYKKLNKETINKRRMEKLSDIEFRKKDRRKRRTYRRKNKTKLNEYKRQEYHNKKGDKIWLLNHYMGTRIRQSLKGSKKSSKWEDLVGYTTDELIKCLEDQFTPKMTWLNYGKYWHVDHKVPLKVFKFITDSDLSFKNCWSLRNLRPLTGKANLRKGAKILKKYESLYREWVLEPSI